MPNKSSVPNESAGRPTAGVADLSYEQARDELVAVVARLEAGGETLEGSLALWERGEALAARCQQWLDGARARLEAVRSPEATASRDHGPSGGGGVAGGGRTDGDATDDAGGGPDDE